MAKAIALLLAALTFCNDGSEPKEPPEESSYSIAFNQAI
jgi:hypothetical protein